MIGVTLELKYVFGVTPEEVFGVAPEQVFAVTLEQVFGVIPKLE